MVNICSIVILAITRTIRTIRKRTTTTTTEISPKPFA
jgi:hypothetical protein